MPASFVLLRGIEAGRGFSDGNQRPIGALRGFWCSWAGAWTSWPPHGVNPSSIPCTELPRRLLPLIPTSLLVQQVLPEPDRIVILTKPKSPASCCPVCGHASGRVHSRYQRTLADLPWQGRIVALRVQA